MPGESRAHGANRGSRRVQSAPGEPLGWSRGATTPVNPGAGGNRAFENLRSIISATYPPLAISALVAAVGTMGMVHPVLLTQMLVVACGASCAVQLLGPGDHVLPAGISGRNPTTSASEFHIYPLFPWGDRGSPRGAAPVTFASVSGGASPPDRAVEQTGEITGRGGSRTTANGHILRVPSPGNILSMMYPPCISELH